MEQNQPAPSPAPAETQNTPSPEESLKAIASEFPVEEQAKQFTATPQPQQPTYQQQIQDFAPDPVTNPDGYKAFMQAQWQAQQSSHTQLRQLSEQFSKFQQTIEEQRVNAEVDAAVQKVNSKLKVEPDLAEALLNVEYKQNQTFKHIWDNRHRNPDAAQRALDVLADKLYSKVQVRQDPQLAENVRAAQTSQRTMATTKQTSQNDEWDNLSPADFERKWRAMSSGV